MLAAKGNVQFSTQHAYKVHPTTDIELYTQYQHTQNQTVHVFRGGGGGELLLLLLLGLRRLNGLLGLRLLDILRGTFRGLGESEYDDDLPRRAGGPLPLLGENDLDRERAGLRIGERERLRTIGDLLGGLRGRRGGVRRRGGRGERRRIGLLRPLLGEALMGDRILLDGDKGERPLDGDAGLRRGGESPRR